MEIFNNQQRSGYEEIVSYGPKWWTEFREMDANYRFAGWTLDLMAYWLERVVNNQFPANADERTITTVFEPALRIEPEPDETLEERRKTAAAYWSGTGKLSKTVIQSIIKAYTGCESELWWNGVKLQIRIFCDEDGQFSQRKIHNIISRRYPAAPVVYNPGYDLYIRFGRADYLQQNKTQDTDHMVGRNTERFQCS